MTPEQAERLISILQGVRMVLFLIWVQGLFALLLLGLKK